MPPSPNAAQGLGRGGTRPDPSASRPWACSWGLSIPIPIPIWSYAMMTFVLVSAGAAAASAVVVLGVRKARQARHIARFHEQE